MQGIIFLIGFMGSGKTTVGRVLSRMLDVPFADTDEMIETRRGMPVSRIFEQFGEPCFRDLETQTLKLLDQDGKDLVISVGGGLPVRSQNRELMHRIGRVVFLTAREETLVERLSGSSDRPLLQGVDLRERIRSLSAARQEMYLDAADYQVATDGKTPEEIAREIIRVSGVQEMATDQKGAADAS